jgi:hypothetical protein
MAGPQLFHSNTYESDYESFHGGFVTPVTATILTACAKAADWGDIRLSQGGLSTAVAASAKTHFGLDVGDIALDGRTKKQVWKLSAALKRSGILPFPRGFVQDSFQNNKHIHFVRYPAKHAHQQAKDQLTEYLQHDGDGLVGSAAYTGPDTRLDFWKESPYNSKNIKPGAGTYYVSVEQGSSLKGLDVDRKQKFLRKRGFKIKADKLVHRWGRWNAVTKFDTYYSVDYLTTQKP